MFSRPMFRWEYLAATRKRRPFVFRTFLALVLGGVALATSLVIFRSGNRYDDATTTLLVGRSVFVATIAAEMVVLVFLVPALVAGSIAEERERDTLPSLLLTRLTPLEIVLTKAAARWLSTVNLLLTGLPLLAASAWAAGLELEMLLALVGLASSSAFMAALAMLASSAREQAANARAQSMLWLFGWLLGPPFLSIIPVGTSTLWGMLMAEVKALCRLLAPSSPLSLVTDHRWYSSPASSTLEARVAGMVGLQALFGLLALALAAMHLKPRDTNPSWLDPTRGYRPPCGDDPILWREYELPVRRRSGSVVMLRLRYLLIVLRMILLNLITLAGLLIALAIPIGCLLATLFYGSEAFEEIRQYGYGWDRRFVKRENLNGFVRAATGLLALFPLLNLSSLVAGRISGERDKKTWEVLLATPLSGTEILRSKALATLYGQNHGAFPLLAVVWALGIALGAVWPPGVLLAAIDLVLAAWAFLALGLYFSLRPGATGPASNPLTLTSLVMLAVHAAMLWVVLATPRQLRIFSEWDALVRLKLALAVLLVPVVTGVVAWSLTRRTLGRVDAWVGRPVRADTATNRGARAETPAPVPASRATAQ